MERLLQWFTLSEDRQNATNGIYVGSRLWQIGGMAAVSVAEMRRIEEEAMRGGISEAELMGMAGVALGRAMGMMFPEVGRAVAFLGKGHNAGDALIALRVLRDEFGWETGVRSAFPKEEWAELTLAQWDESLEMEDRGGNLLLIDGLLGIGAKGAPRGRIAELIGEMNELRDSKGALVAAVDVPSGTDPDSGEIYAGAVRADVTFMIGAAKVGLLLGSAVNAVGAISLVEVEGLAGGEGKMELIAPQTMNFGKAPRDFDFHKGKAGRVAILAGSPQFTGAAIISALGAVRAGAGLVTLHAPSAACDGIRSRLPLEAMLKACDDPRELLREKCDALVVGPGLGDMEGGVADGLVELITSAKVPIVVDADALNLLAKRGVKASAGCVLTPHPGEFARLASDLSEKTREEAVREFLKGSEAVLLLKGARTIVGKKGETLRINSTGTPAMSNGGQGDLLSGVIGALLGGGMDNYDAASLGAWLCGRAGEISEIENGSPATATENAFKLGLAMQDWKRASC
ncbi:MAG: NAD(P)H-hydrate dehydratase [Luteolibacter sp.]